jgi:hypothetical protein
MKVAVGRIWNGNSNKAGLTTQAAYAITNNFAATISYNTQNEKEKSDVDWSLIFPSRSGDIGRYYKRKNFSIGGGYYKVIGEKQNRSLNLYGGVGFGRVNVKEDEVLLHTTTPEQTLRNVKHYNKVTRYYLHPSYSIMPGKVFRGNFGARFTLAHFNAFKSDLPEGELEYRYWTMENKTFLYLEPSVNLQFFLIPDVMAFDMGLTMSIRATPSKNSLPISSSFTTDHMNANRGLIFYTRFSFDFSR